jgi:NAD(P)H-nitrite reductase large subunit
LLLFFFLDNTKIINKKVYLYKCIPLIKIITESRMKLFGVSLTLLNKTWVGLEKKNCSKIHLHKKISLRIKAIIVKKYLNFFLIVHM